jgi:hypothetical protein
MQRLGKQATNTQPTIEDVHCYATDIFSMGPPRVYISSSAEVVVGQKGVSPRQSWKKGSAENLL